MKKYTIKKVTNLPINWDEIEKAEIDTYAWLDNGYTPRVYAALCYDEEAIHVRFWAHESQVRAIHKSHGEMVCEDSCVELFLKPQNDDRYLNFEVNVLGYMLLGLGTSRHGREDIEVLPSFAIESSVKDAETYQDDMWTVGYKIPFAFLKSIYGDIDFVTEGIRANLYTCGEYTKMPHYGMWNPVLLPSPEYHAPAYFGEMVFAK